MTAVDTAIFFLSGRFFSGINKRNRSKEITGTGIIWAPVILKTNAINAAVPESAVKIFFPLTLYFSRKYKERIIQNIIGVSKVPILLYIIYRKLNPSKVIPAIESQEEKYDLRIRKKNISDNKEKKNDTDLT